MLDGYPRNRKEQYEEDYIRERESGSAAAWTIGHSSEHPAWGRQHRRDGTPDICRWSRRGPEQAVDRRYYPEFAVRTDNDERFAANIAGMTDAEIRDRYHKLVDKRFESVLTPAESLQLKYAGYPLHSADPIMLWWRLLCSRPSSRT